MAATRVSIAGRIRIERDGVELDGGVLDSRRSRLIVASLATAPDGLTSRALAERLWDTAPATAGAALRGAIARLRDELKNIGLGEQNLIVTTATGWRLAPSATVDVIEAADRILSLDAEPMDSLTTLAVIDQLWTTVDTPILPSDHAPWVDELRDQQARLRSRALELRVGAAVDADQFALATSAAATLLEADPLSERSHRLLMNTLSAAGDRAGAIRAYEQCRAVLAEELGVDPSQETTDLYLELLRSGSSLVDTIPPLPRNGFFGRERLLEEVSASLDQRGITTVFGRGGVGKTRLALHVIHSARPSLAGAHHWVGLGDITDAALARVVVASGVGAEASADPLRSAIELLRQTADDVLVLDGCENVLDGIAEIVVELIETLPELRILVTSRVPLGISGERRFEAGQLPVAAPGLDGLVRSAAVRLLAERTESHGGRLVVDARNLDSVRSLCERCEGIPLALELAAAQLSTMAVGDLLDAFAADAGGALDALDVLLGQSFAALDSDSASLFSAWGAVNGALPLVLVRGLVGDSIAPGRVARLLGQLSDSGLVIVDRAGPRWKYRMDDHIRGFARDRLAESGLSRARLSALADALRELLPADPRTPPSSYRDAISDAGDGFRSVLSAAAEDRIDRQVGLELAFRLHRYWAASGIAEGRLWLARLLTDVRGGPWTPFAFFAAGYLSYWAADTGAALVELRTAARELHGVDDGFAARALVFAAGISDDLDDADAAMEEIAAAIDLARQLDDPNLLITASMGVGSLLAERGTVDAMAPVREALDLCRRIASSDQLQATLATAAMIAWQVGCFAEAREWIAEASPLLDGPSRIAQVVLATAAAGCDLEAGNLDSAARLAALATTGADELGVDRELPLALAVAARIALARGEHDAATALALRCVDAAESLAFAFPSAIALETAAAVTGDNSGSLLTAASAIRAAGRRPAPAGLAPTVDETALDNLGRLGALGVARAALSRT